MSGANSTNPRRVLHESSPSHQNALAKIRLVPSTPPRLLALGPELDEVYSRTPLPTHPSHLLDPFPVPVPVPVPDPDPVPGKGRVYQHQGQEQGSASFPRALDEQFQFQFQFQQRITRGNTGQPPNSGGGSSQSSQSSQSFQSSLPYLSSIRQSSPSSSKPLRNVPKKRSKNRLQIHPDQKTFSLVPTQDEPQPEEDASKSPTSLFFSTRDILSDSIPFNQGHAKDRSRCNSTKLCRSETSSPICPATPASPQRKQPTPADHIITSPWHYPLVGGLRQVPKTPDLEQRAATSSVSPLPETSDGPPTTSHHLSTKSSFQSTETATTTSENTNYKLYGDESPSESEVAPPSSSGSNYQVLAESSPSGSVIYRPQTVKSENEDNEPQGDNSIAADSYVHPDLPGGYSQEALVVPPLNPKARKQRSVEILRKYKSRSRETLRTASLTSISTVFSQQDAFLSILGTGSFIQLPNPILKHRPKGTSTWAPPQKFNPPRSHMQEHPHQWSSQLSTVLSVSDGETDRHSRSWSSENGWRSSGYRSTPSHHSRQMRSISSSQALGEDQSSLIQSSRSGSFEPPMPPMPAFMRNGRQNSTTSIRMVEEQDEYGDGITDMQDLRTRSSRRRLSTYFSSSSSDAGRTNTMRSTTSSRSNSLLPHTIPTWAKLYYGSGERHQLGAPGTPVQRGHSRFNSLRSGSGTTGNSQLSISSPRRRYRDGESQGSLDITPVPQQDTNRRTHDPSTSRHRTWSMSSMWSPHLRLDKRAKHRSAWNPPSVNWSAESGKLGRRNMQLLMFIAGFVFPFAWMIAAFLPLPPNPELHMREQDNSTSNLDEANATPNHYARQFGPMDERRYESAKWWRNLNRWMSVVGLLILATIVTLVVVGIKQDWEI
ncbi:uncharacterized protein L3040_008634 [Drepanopeziza brunnea f. sp. 'multigermtubi']|uniref:uncharacterized protein n=1 Tax=Drepanopeziza brunnea f. sp. 'multigermtubi' TaxID=698441 RepID=UPI0023933587|nr:hypothetical protein L3040_008634 [Drepanopeziza brunnea f. sp. 'multigermtubi']